MEKFRKILKHKEEDLGPALLRKHKIICRQLPFKDAASVLYLAKSNWTNRFDPNRQSTVGIFFSLWVSPDLIAQEQFAYNIHSKQLRKLPGYTLASRKFADEFRLAVKDRVDHWPGIGLNYGPLTLLEGRDTCNIDTFAEKVEQRVDDFIGIHEEIDHLLTASTC